MIKNRDSVTLKMDCEVKVKDFLKELSIEDILYHIDYRDFLTEINVHDIIKHLEDNGYIVLKGGKE